MAVPIGAPAGAAGAVGAAGAGIGSSVGSIRAAGAGAGAAAGAPGAGVTGRPVARWTARFTTGAAACAARCTTWPAPPAAPAVTTSPVSKRPPVPAWVASITAWVPAPAATAPGSVVARPAGVKASKPPRARGMSPTEKPGGMAYSFWSTDDFRMKFPLASWRASMPGKLAFKICTVSCGLETKVPKADFKEATLIWFSSGMPVHSGRAWVSGVARRAPVTISPTDSKNPIF